MEEFFKPWHKRLSSWHSIVWVLVVTLLISWGVIWLATVRLNSMARISRMDFDDLMGCSEKLRDCEVRCPSP